VLNGYNLTKWNLSEGRRDSGWKPNFGMVLGKKCVQSQGNLLRLPFSIVCLEIIYISDSNKSSANIIYCTVDCRNFFAFCASDIYAQFFKFLTLFSESFSIWYFLWHCKSSSFLFHKKLGLLTIIHNGKDNNQRTK
jgi:hypothetical protein